MTQGRGNSRRSWRVSRWVVAPFSALLGTLLALPATALTVVSAPPAASQPDAGWQTFRTFGSAEGLPQSTVYALAQDRAGFLWAATQVGLARYDTRRWEPVALPVEGAPPHVNRLAASGDGALWVGTEESGLFRLTGDKVEPITAGERVLQPVEALLAVGADQVWVGIQGALFRCAPGGCREVEAASGLLVSALVEGPGPAGPALWVGTAFEGVRRLDLAGETPTLADWRLGREEGLPDSAVRALSHWQGELWIGSGRGVSRLSGDRLIVYDQRVGFPRSGVFAFAASLDGNGQPCLWSAQFGGGLARFAADGSWYHLGSDDGLPEDYLLSLLVTDPRGAMPLLWAGTGSSGVVRQERGRWRAWGERSGLPHRSVVGLGEVVEAGGDTVLWAGTLGGAARWARGRWQPWLRDLLGERVLYDAANHEGALWLATNQGLLRWDGTTARWYTSDDSVLPGLSLHDLETRRGPAGRPELWVTTNHGIARLAGGEITAFDSGQPFSGPRSLAAGASLPGGEQELWLAAGNGVFRLRGESWEALPASCVPATEAVHVLWQAESSTLWVAHRHGLTRVAGEGRCRTLARGEGVHPPLYQLTLDRHGFIYAFGYDGAVRLPTGTSGRGRPAVERFGIQDGLPELEFNRAAFTDRRGRVWAATVGGTTGFDPGEHSGRGAPGPLHLLRAARDGGRRLQHDDELPHGTANANFDFVLLSYGREEKIRYRTQLAGLENAPGPWTTQSSVSYTRLPAGGYRFQVWARDPAGTVVGPLGLPFTVAPPWWGRSWVLTLAALALVSTGLGLGRLRARALARRAHELERQVGERTAELADANRRLEEAALTDPLTGAHNRRYLELRAEDDAANARRRVQRGERDGHLALVLVDIDRFKRVNDRFGHAVGDEVLCAVARRLRALVRQEDALVRWGGEEFLVLLRDVDERALPVIAHRVLHEIGGAPIVTAAGQLPVTCSAGIVPFPLGEGDDDFEAVLRRADEALYAAKEGGRNRAVVVQAGDDGAELRHQTVLGAGALGGAA